MNQYRLGTDLLERSSAEMKLAWCEPAVRPCDQQGNRILVCVKKEKRVKGDDPSPLLCRGEATSGVLCPVLGSPAQER